MQHRGDEGVAIGRIDALTAALADLDETTLSAAEVHEQLPALLRLRN